MGKLDPSPIPPHAITCWLTDRDIIVLVPMTNPALPPYMMKFALSEGGLMQALELLKKRKHEVLTPLEAQAAFTPPRHQPQVRVSKAQERLYAETTPEQRENAKRLLEKLGIKR